MKKKKVIGLPIGSLLWIAALFGAVILTIPARGQDQNLPSPINSTLPRNQVIETIPVGTDPLYLVVSPNNAYVYVANTGANTISKIDASTYAVSTFAVPFAGALAITPNGEALYVTSSMALPGNGSNSVYELSTTTGDTLNTFTVGVNPDALAISPNGKQVWVTSDPGENAGSISIIDTVTQKVLPGAINLGGYPDSIVFSPAGTDVYAGPSETSEVAMSLIATSSHKILNQKIPLAQLISPNGKELYSISESVNVISTQTKKVTKQLTLGGVFVNGAAVTPKGTYLYVPFVVENGRSSPELYMINAATDKIIGGPILLSPTIEATYANFGAAIAPDGKFLYISDYVAGVVYVVDIRPE